MSETNAVVQNTPTAPKASTAVATAAPKTAAKKGPVRVSNNHSDRTAQVKILHNGKEDYVTVMPRGRVDLPEGATVIEDEVKNPNLRIVS